jgi:hypothetical protein
MNNVMTTKASLIMQPVTNIEETSWQNKISKGGKSFLVLKIKLLSIESASQAIHKAKNRELFSFTFTQN